MPGFLTHYIAGQAVLGSTKSDIRKIIENSERLYNLGTQGPDIFFYYIPGTIRKRSRGVGTQMHRNDLGKFLTQMAEVAKQSTETERDIIFAYTAGFIMHYVTDANTHPYVYARTHQQNVSNIKNSTDHRRFETAIDTAMLKLVQGKHPAAYKQWQLIAADPTHMKIAAAATGNVLAKIYNRQIPTKDIYRAMRHMVRLTRLIQSRKGRRKRFVSLVENLTIGHPLNSSLVHDQVVDPGIDYLNEKNTPWQAPWENAETYTDSFIDRYHAATREGLEMIQHLHSFIYDETPLAALIEKLGNRSLKTGLTCEPS